MRPLEGIRVVEAAQMIAGPLAGMVLAEQGADVIKVEMADGVGDRLRMLGTRRGDVSALFPGVNRGKRSVVLDTKTESGLTAMRTLAAGADVFLQNFRPGAADRMGIGEAALRAENPDLIYVSVSGFGTSGPDANQKVYDYVIQAMTGMAALQSDEQGTPMLTRQFIVDKVTALTVSQAITAALFQRERGHGGQHLELAMLDVGLWLFWPDAQMDRTMLSDDVTHAPHFSSMYDVKATTDGHVALIAMGNRSWPALCAAFDPDWLDDPRFATMADREANADALGEAFNAAIATLSTAECLRRMRANDVPGAAVVPLAEIHDVPQIVHNDSLVEHHAGPAGRVREARPPVAFMGSDREVAGPAPRLGEHSTEVLTELGFDADTIASWRDDGVLGPAD